MSKVSRVLIHLGVLEGFKEDKNFGNSSTKAKVLKEPILSQTYLKILKTSLLEHKEVNEEESQ